MFCPNCGSQNEEYAKFCSKCGAKFEIEEAAAPVEPEVPVAPVQPQYTPVYTTQQQYTSAQSQAQYQYTQPQYTAPVPPQYNPYMPFKPLKCDWSLLTVWLLSFVTCGIYGYYFYYQISEDINTIASRYDGKKTMNWLLAFLIISPLTCYIYGIVWMHQFSERVGDELARRGLNEDFGAKDFWLWNVLGSFIIVGPFIYLHKLCNAMNALAADYNVRG